MAAYYNELDPYAVGWLQNLEAGGHVASGLVDARSILDVRPDDVRSWSQAHFFAGLGGWSHALQLAGWPDDKPVWTGSCPCQPFSQSGRKRGFDDERHLWPEWFRLIRECKPPILFGEQVANADGLQWFDLVQADLESAGYAVGAADLCAAGVGAPHLRQRLYFVAVYDGKGSLGNADGSRLEGSGRGQDDQARREEPFGRSAPDAGGQGDRPRRSGFWDDAIWIPCTDGKARPVGPGVQPLAHGVPARVGKLRSAGNAIVPQVAATFIRATMQVVRRKS